MNVNYVPSVTRAPWPLSLSLCPPYLVSLYQSVPTCTSFGEEGLKRSQFTIDCSTVQSSFVGSRTETRLTTASILFLRSFKVSEFRYGSFIRERSASPKVSSDQKCCPVEAKGRNRLIKKTNKNQCPKKSCPSPGDARLERRINGMPLQVAVQSSSEKRITPVDLQRNNTATDKLGEYYLQ